MWYQGFCKYDFWLSGETEEDFDLSVEFIKKIKPNAIGAYLLEAYPGTALYEQLIDEGKLPVHYCQDGCIWSDVDVQRQIRHLNLSSMQDDMFNNKMKNFRRKVVSPLTTADLLKNTSLKCLKLSDITKVLIKLVSQPLRVARVISRLIKK